MHEVKFESKAELFLFKFYSVNLPTVMMPNGIFNKICDATVSAFWMFLNEQLNCLKHLRRQLDGSISLVQCAKPATSVPAHRIYEKSPN